MISLGTKSPESLDGLLQDFLLNVGVKWIHLQYATTDFDALDVPLGFEIIKG